MSDDYKSAKVTLDEDDVIQAKVRLDGIKAIADSLITIDREGWTDGLYKHTVLNLMETIDRQVNEATALLDLIPKPVADTGGAS